MTAALDPRVTFFAAVHPALCDHEAFMKKRACGWPHYFYYYGAPDAKELKWCVIMIRRTLPVVLQYPAGSVGDIMMMFVRRLPCMPLIMR